jgi:hypothetical protein
MQPVPLPEAGFEEGGARWDLSAAAGTAQITKEAAHSGNLGLRIASEKDDTGAFVAGPRVPVERGLSYRLTWQGRVVRGGGTNIYLRFLDADGREVQRDEGRVNNEKGGAWVPGKVDAVPPAEAAFVEVMVQRPGFRVFPYTVDIDDLALSTQPLVAEAPWPGTYKLRPDDSARLTAADVVGPDGRVYPDWTRAGVPGGIPELPVALRLEDLGAQPEGDISGLLEQAAREVSAKGGGVIALGEGRFFLDQPVFIVASNVVLRGAGPEKTRLVFRYQVPSGEIRFFRLEPGQEVGPAELIEIHANPKNLVALELKAGAKSISRRTRQDHWGNTFSLTASGSQALAAAGEGARTLTAVAEYADGARVERSIELRLVARSENPPRPGNTQLAALTFAGRGEVSEKIPLRADARRGSRTLVLGPNHKLAAGDRLSLIAPASERWKRLVGSTSHWHIQAQDMMEVTAVEGDRVELRQPVRTDFLVEDDSFVQKQEFIGACGVEGLALEQQVVPKQPATGQSKNPALKNAVEDLWISGITFNRGWGCWIKDVTVTNAGRNAVYFPQSKHIEVRDCRFTNSLFKADGGTGYIGFDRTWDSLMDTIEVRAMRHAPNVQWNAAGNVIRNSRFLNSDAQWHAGFTVENLFENNFVDGRTGTGAYGHGLYASGPWSGIHGPQGPRNVVYNNDIVSRKDCLHMLGGNEGWLILFNRLVTDNGRAVYAREKSFDHIIAGNVFVLRQAVLPAVYLGVDSTGVELVDNAFYGVTPPLVGFAGGITRLARDEGNTLSPEVPTPLPARPMPAVPSIFEWQRAHLAEIRAKQEGK